MRHGRGFVGLVAHRNNRSQVCANPRARGHTSQVQQHAPTNDVMSRTGTAVYRLLAVRGPEKGVS